MHRRGTPFIRVLLTALLAVPAVTAAAPAMATNDAHWSLQWGPKAIRVESPWVAGVVGAGVKIGIVDSGVNVDHRDLRGKVAPGDAIACIGTDGDQAKCSGSGEDVDNPGHGTHVAGIAAAHKDNGEGIAGIAPGAQLVVARVFDGNTASSDDVNAGIRWVVDRGARVVNLSVGDLLPFGEVFRSDDLKPGIDYAWRAGAIAVLAAGNTNIGGVGSANYGAINAVVVGATGPGDRPASYSSPTGSAQWAIMAPGGDGGSSGVYSTLRAGGYGYLSGTSMAAPHVAGALALLLSQGRSPQNAVDTLRASAVNRTSACGANSPTCVGRLDVCALGPCNSSLPADQGTQTDPAPQPQTGPESSTSGSAGVGGSGGTEPASGGGPAASPTRAGGTGAGSRATRSRPVASTAAPAAATPGLPQPADAGPAPEVPPPQPVGDAASEEPPAERSLSSLNSARRGMFEERADPLLVTAAAAGGLLLLVASSGLRLRRRRRQPN